MNPHSVMIAIGIFFIGVFLIVKFGIVKSWIIVKTLPGLLSARLIYAILGIGIWFIASSIISQLPIYNPHKWDVTDIFLLFFTLLPFWFMYKMPNWLDPKWLQWLKNEYGYCLAILIEEAQQMNRWDWERQVRTQEEMQQWIDTVYERRKEDIDFYWQYEKLYRVEQQMNKQKRHRISPGMEVEGYIPVHRQGDNVLVREEIDAVVAFTNDLLLQQIDKKK